MGMREGSEEEFEERVGLRMGCERGEEGKGGS